MSDELLVRHCSPTLAGLKTANMFSCSFENREDMTKSIRKLNRVLGKKGVRVLPLRFSGNQGLIYVYRPEKLSEDLSRNGAGCILSERGYCMDSTGRCIGHLMQRISEQKEFPHEIGLFLGYPPEDVRGFMEHQGRNCKCSGCWKVYGDEDRARRRFADYRRCTGNYCRRWARGATLEALTVPGR